MESLCFHLKKACSFLKVPASELVLEKGGYVLPPWESIALLSDEDAVTVRLRSGKRSRDSKAAKSAALISQGPPIKKRKMESSSGGETSESSSNEDTSDDEASTSDSDSGSSSTSESSGCESSSSEHSSSTDSECPEDEPEEPNGQAAASMSAEEISAASFHPRSPATQAQGTNTPAAGVSELVVPRPRRRSRGGRGRKRQQTQQRQQSFKQQPPSRQAQTSMSVSDEQVSSPRVESCSKQSWPSSLPATPMQVPPAVPPYQQETTPKSDKPQATQQPGIHAKILSPLPLPKTSPLAADAAVRAAALAQTLRHTPNPATPVEHSGAALEKTPRNQQSPSSAQRNVTLSNAKRSKQKTVMAHPRSKCNRLGHLVHLLRSGKYESVTEPAVT